MCVCWGVLLRAAVMGVEQEVWTWKVLGFLMALQVQPLQTLGKLRHAQGGGGPPSPLLIQQCPHLAPPLVSASPGARCAWHAQEALARMGWRWCRITAVSFVLATLSQGSEVWGSYPTWVLKTKRRPCQRSPLTEGKGRGVPPCPPPTPWSANPTSTPASVLHCPSSTDQPGTP